MSRCLLQGASYLPLMNDDAYVDWVLHACGSGTGSGGPWERVLACMQLRAVVMQLMLFLFWGLNFGIKVRGDDEINFEGC